MGRPNLYWIVVYELLTRLLLKSAYLLGGKFSRHLDLDTDAGLLRIGVLGQLSPGSCVAYLQCLNPLSKPHALYMASVIVKLMHHKEPIGIVKQVAENRSRKEGKQ
jgi:hypothetical protein